MPEYDDWPQIEAAARWRLKTMELVGITERFDETVELLCSRLGIPCPPLLPQTNINPRKGRVDVGYYRRTTPPDIIEMIEDWMSHDRALYVLAKGLFEQQLAACRARPRRFYSLAPRIRMARLYGDWQTWLG